MDGLVFPILKTDRLILRALTRDDWEEILFLRSDPGINAFIKRPLPRQTNTKDQAFEFIERINGKKNTREWLYWCITRKDNPTTIGTICLWNFTSESETAELGYDLNPMFQGQGLMSEAIEKVIHFGFHKLHKLQLEAFTHKNNARSIRLLNRHGFKENTLRQDPFNSDNRIFERSKNELA